MSCHWRIPTQFIRNFLLQRFQKVSILSNLPTLCGLLCSDGGMTHAVSVCGKVLFDRNVNVALILNRENLNWWCGAEGVTAEYVKVHLAYQF